jgi:Reverse transcriptase (RNA-dependent DNA polymerase)
VVLNSIAGRKIILSRGVRQEDPISPYIFIIKMDFLPTWIKKLNELQVLQSPFQGCRSCLLYADDTLLFIKSEESQLRTLKLILHIFEKMSELKINLLKSELIMTRTSEHQVNHLAQILKCQAATFPIKYLGLPLSNKALTRNQYQLMIDMEEGRLSGWKADKLSTAGRTIMINSVISSMPIFFMSVFYCLNG